MTSRSVRRGDQSRNSLSAASENHADAPGLTGLSAAHLTQSFGASAMVSCHSRTRTGQVIRIERAPLCVPRPGAWGGEKQRAFLKLPTRKAVPGRRRRGGHKVRFWLTSAASALKSGAQIVLEKARRGDAPALAPATEKEEELMFTPTLESTRKRGSHSLEARAPPTSAARNSTSAPSLHASPYWKRCVKINQNGSVWLCGVRKSEYIA